MLDEETKEDGKGGRKMVEVLQLDEKTLYAEDEDWRVNLGDGSPIGLGIVFEAADLSGTEGFGDEEYSIVVEAAILPRPEDLDEEVVLEVSEEESILDLYKTALGM